MAETTGKTSPWIIGGIALGAVIVVYYLYQEYLAAQAAAASAAQNAATTATATSAAQGVVQSAIPDQVASSSPSYPATATVTPEGTVTGTTTAVPTGQPAPAAPTSGAESILSKSPTPQSTLVPGLQGLIL